MFDLPTKNISGYFTYGSLLSISAYNDALTLLGTVNSPAASNLGNSELITLPFDDVAQVVISGALPDTFIMDDFSFTAVPEPASASAVALALLLATGWLRRQVRR
jgi:hypothetical protein